MSRSPPGAPRRTIRRTGSQNAINQYGSFLPMRLNFNSNNEVTQPLPISVINVEIPNNRPTDPISLNTFNKGDMAIRVRYNGRNTYFTIPSFNGWFGNRWKSIPENSNRFISNTKTHPLIRTRVKRLNVRKVRFV